MSSLSPSQNSEKSGPGTVNKSGQIDRKPSRLSLGPSLDTDGLTNWAADLLAQARAGAEVAFGFMFSQEYLNQNTTNEQFVTTSYAAFFDREPDAPGKATWLAALAGGAGRQNVLGGFTDSLEFANLCDVYGILPNLA